MQPDPQATEAPGPSGAAPTVEEMSALCGLIVEREYQMRITRQRPLLNELFAARKKLADTPASAAADRSRLQNEVEALEDRRRKIAQQIRYDAFAEVEKTGYDFAQWAHLLSRATLPHER